MLVSEEVATARNNSYVPDYLTGKCLVRIVALEYDAKACQIYPGGLIFAFVALVVHRLCLLQINPEGECNSLKSLAVNY